MTTKSLVHPALFLATSLSLFVFTTTASPAPLTRIGQLDTADETASIAYDPGTNKLFSTNDELSVQMTNFGDGTNLSAADSIDLSAVFENTRFVSGVAIDPNGRGFGVATVIPFENDTILGKVVFFNTDTGEILRDLDVGFNPDNVSFHPDGSKILVANEAEIGAVTDTAGSISIIDIAGVSLANIAELTNGNVVTTDFSAANLAPGVTLDGIRIDPANAATPPLDLEPEAIVALGDQVFVSLQENNALAVYSLITNQWTAIHNLGSIEKLIDASDDDEVAAIDDRVHGMFQPDGIATYRVAGTTYILTANEGDARDDFEMQFASHGIEGNPFIDPGTLDELRQRYGGEDPTDDEILGRLRISTIDGDTDGDGDIDVPTMFGTRSFSIFNSETGELVYDSGSEFAEIVLEKFPELFNSQGTTGSFDSRSDNKGSEPESIVLGEIDGHVFAFIVLERTGGVMMFDVTDPNNPSFVDYLNSRPDTGSRSPEGLIFISGEMSPDGRSYIAVGYDRSDSIEVFRVVPEPSSIVLALLGLIGLSHRRFRRRMAA